MPVPYYTVFHQQKQRFLDLSQRDRVTGKPMWCLQVGDAWFSYVYKEAAIKAEQNPGTRVMMVETTGLG